MAEQVEETISETLTPTEMAKLDSAVRNTYGYRKEGEWKYCGRDKELNKPVFCCLYKYDRYRYVFYFYSGIKRVAMFQFVADFQANI